jgi:hypothetical protein
MWRKYFLLLVWVILLIPSCIHAIKLEYVNSMLWSDARDVKILGNYAYCAYGCGLLIMDITNPRTPKPLGQCYLPGDMKYVSMNGNYAFLNGWETELYTVDISNPQAPKLLKPSSGFGKSIDFLICNDKAFINDSSGNLSIFNILDPLYPKKIGQCKINRELETICLYKDYLYTCGKTGGSFEGEYGKIEIINYSEPKEPKLIDSVITPNPIRSALIKDGFLYILAAGDGLQIYDLLNPELPILTGEFFFERLGIESQMGISGNYIYISCDKDDNMKIIDISDKQNLIEITSDCTPPYVFKFDIGENLMAVILPDFKLAFYELGQPGSITKLSKCKSYNASDIAISGNYAFVADDNYGMIVLDLTKSHQNNIINEYEVSSGCEHIKINGQYAYLGISERGIQVIDIGKPDTPRMVGQYQFPRELCGPIEAMHTDGNIIYLITRRYGLIIVDAGKPENPIMVGKIHIGYGCSDIDKVGNKIYLASNLDGIRVIDIKNASRPEFIGSYETRGSESIVVKGNYAYMDWYEGLLIFDVTNPSKIKLVDSLKIDVPSSGYFPRGFSRINYFENCLLLTGDYSDSRLAVVDISQPSKPSIKEFIGSFEMVNNVDIYSDKIYIQTWPGIIIYQFSK